VSTIARRVAEEFAAYAGIPVGERDVEEALASFRAVVDAERPRRTRSRVLAAVAVVTAVAVAVGVALAIRRSQPAQPVDRPLGPPSQLIAQYWSHPCWGHEGMVWVFADGRIITESSYPVELGYLERWLTSRGLERLEGELSGLLGTSTNVKHRHPAPGTGYCSGVASVVTVRGQLYNVTENEAMSDLLFDPSWLPDDAWRREEPTIYMPPTYQVCYLQAQIRGALPSGVEELLTRKEDVSNSSGDSCSILTAAETRFVVDTLDPRIPLGTNGAIYEFTARDGEAAIMDFSVILPNGESGSHGG